MNTAQKTVPGWSKRSKGKKLKDGGDRNVMGNILVLVFCLSLLLAKTCAIEYKNKVQTKGQTKTKE